jgi:hypothetical protein
MSIAGYFGVQPASSVLKSQDSSSNRAMVVSFISDQRGLVR